MIRLTDINKSFSTRSRTKQVLNHLSLTISEGDRILMMGESGCGKSTLLNILAGLLPPDSGSIEIGTPYRAIDYTKEQNRAALRYDRLGSPKSLFGRTHDSFRKSPPCTRDSEGRYSRLFCFLSVTKNETRRNFSGKSNASFRGAKATHRDCPRPSSLSFLAFGR